METETLEEGEPMDYNVVRASRKRINKKDKRESGRYDRRASNGFISKWCVLFPFWCFLMITITSFNANGLRGKETAGLDGLLS